MRPSKKSFTDIRSRSSDARSLASDRQQTGRLAAPTQSISVSAVLPHHLARFAFLKFIRSKPLFQALHLRFSVFVFYYFRCSFSSFRQARFMPFGISSRKSAAPMDAVSALIALSQQPAARFRPVLSDHELAMPFSSSEISCAIEF